MAQSNSEAARPISPHLTVYRFTLTMAMSILHRITGVGLYLGMILLVAWLLALASGPQSFATVQGIYGSFLGRVILFLFTWALYHHLIGGIRHFIWDFGVGLDAVWRERLVQGSVGVALGLTVLTWIIGLLAA